METTDKLLRCPITNLYNQRFMIEHLINNLDKNLEEDNSRALISMQIDNLLSINKKYGTLKGDETLKNLVYVVNKVKSDNTIVFKQNGPGLFIYKHEVLKENLKKFVVKLSNEIKESEVFVEPITVSISIVTVDELDKKYSLKERVSQFIELSLMRLERAKLKGKSQVLDKENDQDMYMEGILLLVDEDETYQNLIIKIFKRINYDVIVAKDIYLAYDILENHQIDCIISEINLSKLDGCQFKQRINSEKTYKNIPFVIASHHKNLDVIMRANHLDIDLVLQKPIIPEELIGYIQRIRDKRVIK
ncbi:MAG: response regulator [Candidatus Izemoplasmatales bacterium]